MLDTVEDKKFLYWLRQRLANKYGEKNNDILTRIDDIIYNSTIVKNTIPKKVLQTICEKYFDIFYDPEDIRLLDDILENNFKNNKEKQAMNFVISMLSEIFKSTTTRNNTKDNVNIN